MYLLDTTICIQMLANNKVIIEKLESLGGKISVSVINVGELLYGAYKSRYVTENIASVINLLGYISEVYEIDSETVWIYGRLKAEIIKHFGPKDRQKQRCFRLESLGIFDNDLWIASAAIQHNLILISQDSDFKNLQGFEDLRVNIF